MFGFGLVLLASCMVVVRSCCVPEIYSAEGTMRVYKDGHFFQGEVEMFYNFTLGIHASFHNLSMDEFPDTFSLSSSHIDMNTGLIYVMIGNTCKTSKLDLSWLHETEQPHCIPSSAYLERDVYIGGPHEDIEVMTYGHKVNDGERHLTVTTHHCYPIQDVFYSRNSTVDHKSIGDGTILQVKNLVLSVADPSVFDIPAICPKHPSLGPAEIPHTLGLLPNVAKYF